MEEQKQNKREIVPQRLFPRVSLREALSIPRVLYQEFSGMATSPVLIASALQMSASSDKWRYLTGASMAYGLTIGAYRVQKIELTALGREIFSSKNEEGVIESKLQAIMMPQLMREFYSLFDDSGFPNDEQAEQLLTELRIPKVRIAESIRILKENAAESSLEKQDKSTIQRIISLAMIPSSSQTFSGSSNNQSCSIAIESQYMGEKRNLRDINDAEVSGSNLSIVHLERFKKFPDIQVHLRPFSVLMGENSSGKTTVLQAINSSLIVLSSNDFIVSSNDSIKIRDTGIGLPILPGIALSDYRSLFYGKTVRGGLTGGSGDINITLLDQRSNAYRLQVRSLFGNINVKCLSKPEDLGNNPELHRKPPIYISGFVGLNISEERAFPASIKDRLRAGQISVVIRNLLLDTKENRPDKFRDLEERLVKDFGFSLGDILFEKQNDLYVTATYEEETLTGRNLSLDFTSSGSGFMQVLQILAPIYRFCPDESSIVLLDEPDAHLHPNLQATLARTLREIQKELDIQIIVSTHSTTIIRSADPSEVIPISSSSTINKPLASSEEVEVEIEERLDKTISTYDLGKSVISGKIVFLEDQDTSILEAFDKVSLSRCFTGANTVPLLKGRGKDDKIPYHIGKVIKDLMGREVEIHFVRDGDGLNENWRTLLRDHAHKYGVILHHLERHEVENYLLCPQLIFRALNEKSVEKRIPSEVEIKDKICEFLRDTIQLTRYNFMGNLEDSIAKIGILVGRDEYRKTSECRSEASKIHKCFDEYSDYDDLVRVGMGKEALKSLMKWVNDDLKINFSKKDIFAESILCDSDVPEEILNILRQLRSKVLDAQN